MDAQELSQELAKMAREFAESHGRGFDAFEVCGRLKFSNRIPLDTPTLIRLNDMVENLLDTVWTTWDATSPEAQTRVAAVVGNISNETANAVENLLRQIDVEGQ